MSRDSLDASEIFPPDRAESTRWHFGQNSDPPAKILTNGKQARIQVPRSEVNEPHVVKLESVEAICYVEVSDIWGPAQPVIDPAICRDDAVNVIFICVGV